MRVKIAQFLAGAAALAASLLFAGGAQALDIQHVVSDQGIEAWLVEEHAVPLIVMEAAWEAGSAQDPEGKEGLAMMLASLLDEGAGDMDSQTYQSRLDDLAVHLSFNAGRDTLGARLKTLTENRDEAFDLFRMALEDPRFDESAVARIRDQQRVSVVNALDDPGSVASRAWYRTALEDHPYAHARSGTLKSIDAIGRADIAAAHGKLLARDNLHVAVVGDIDAAALKKLLDKTFGGLPAESGGRPVPEGEVTGAPGTHVIERDFPQSVAMFGHGGIKRDDPDFIPAYIMNHILGGGSFTARLTNEVREKRGLAYSVGSYFYPLRDAGLFIGRVATANARVKESLDIIRAEIARMAGEGVTEDELKDAKTYLTGSYPLRFDSNEKIADQLIGLQVGGLGIDYVDKRNGLIEEVTQDDIARAAERLLHPDNLIVTVVGNPQGIETTQETGESAGAQTSGTGE